MLSALAFSLIAATTADADSAALLTEMVTAALGKEQKLDVLASADVRRQLEVESSKQVLGCAEEQSCLAEIANAMGARYVVYGKLGMLDDVVVLTLHLFDSEKAQAAGRVVVKDKGLSALSDKVEPAVRELTAGLVSQLADGSRVRVLVLDVEAPRATVEPATAAPLSAMAWAGWGGVLGGAIGAAVGVGAFVLAAEADKKADNLSLRVDESAGHYTDRDTSALVGFMALGSGVVALGGGVALLTMDALQPPDEETTTVGGAAREGE